MNEQNQKRGLFSKNQKIPFCMISIIAAKGILKTIAIELDGCYEESEKWPKSRLYRMIIPIVGLRLWVISGELAADLDEFLAFRHLRLTARCE